MLELLRSCFAFRSLKGQSVLVACALLLPFVAPAAAEMVLLSAFSEKEEKQTCGREGNAQLISSLHRQAKLSHLRFGARDSHCRRQGEVSGKNHSTKHERGLLPGHRLANGLIAPIRC